MFSCVVVRFVQVGGLRDDAQHVPFEEVQLSMLAVAQPLRRIDDRVEDRLEPAPFCDST